MVMNDIYGDQWLYMVINGCIWWWMVIYGDKWLLMVINGYIWWLMVIYGYIYGY